MASTVASSRSEERSKIKYQTSYSMVFNNLDQLGRDKAVLTSPIFTCADDPLRASFKVKLGFGTTRLNKMDVKIIPTSADVYLFKYTLRIYRKDDDLDTELKKGNFKSGVKRARSVTALNSVWDYSLQNYIGEMEASHEGDGPLDNYSFQIVLQYAVAEVTDENIIYDNQCRLIWEYKSLLDEPKDADITIIVQDESFKCHKVMLVARSTYFQTLFQSGMIESQSNQITMVDVTPEIMRHVLQYLYSGTLPENMEELAFDLLPFADKYVLEELKVPCENAIRPLVTVDNVIRTVVMADMHSCSNLFLSCISLFKENVDDLMKREEWKMISQPLLLRLFSSCCNKEVGPVICDPVDQSPAKRLSDDMSRMFNSGYDQVNSTDVTLVSEDGQLIHAHRLILCARSEYFRDVFATSGDLTRHHVPGTAVLVREVLVFFYSGLAPGNLESVAVTLLPLASIYKADGLKELCVCALRGSVTVENLVDVLVCSDASQCQELFDYCLPLFKANASRLNPESLEKLKAKPELLFKLTQRCAE